MLNPLILWVVGPSLQSLVEKEYVVPGLKPVKGIPELVGGLV